MKLWGGRFQTGPSQIFEEFSGSLAFDQKLVFADIKGSQAFARALGRHRIVNTEETSRWSRREEIADETTQSRISLLAASERHVQIRNSEAAQKAGALSSKIHTGRSRNEQVSLDVRLYLRVACETLLADVVALSRALLNLAARYPEAVIPGTHICAALKLSLAALSPGLFRNVDARFERLQQAHARINVLPLGSGALAGSGFPFDREAIAGDLDFPAITRNSMDVSADRDFALDFLYACSLIMLHLSRLSEDWILYSSEEFNWMSLGDGVTSGSSLMPQKKNPDSLELIRGKTGRVFGDLTSLFVTMKGLPMTYNRDMQEDKEPLFDAFHQTGGSLRMARAVTETIVLNPEIPVSAAEESWVIATDLAEELARRGVPFHDAHQIVGRLVLESVNSGKKPSDWTAEALAAFAPEFSTGMDRLLVPAEGMKSREFPADRSFRGQQRAS